MPTQKTTKEAGVSAASKIQSKLSANGKTTLPKVVREALGLSQGDKIRYVIRPEGEVILSRVDSVSDNDPVLEEFLRFLAKDITRNPEKLEPLNGGFLDRIKALVADVEVDLNEPLEQLEPQLHHQRK